MKQDYPAPGRGQASSLRVVHRPGPVEERRPLEDRELLVYEGLVARPGA